MAVKVHNPNPLDLDQDLPRLRALARQEEDPVARAVQQAHLPVPVKGKPAKAQAPAKSEASCGKSLPVQTPPLAEKAPAVVNEPSADDLKKKLRRCADIIRHCEALELLNDSALQLADYPQAHALVIARWRRDLWWLACLLTAAVALLGLAGWIPPWAAGVAAGILVLMLAAGVPAIARFCLPDFASYAELRRRQRELEYAAIAHIRMLEGAHGLAWHCQMMLDQDPRLGQRRYQRLVELSKHKKLIKALRGVGAFRLYLQYLRLARASFVQVKQDYVATSGALKQKHGQIA